MMQTEVQQLTLQSDKDTGERIITAIALSGYPAVRSMLFKIEQGFADILGRFPSLYLCQVAIESVKPVPGVVRVRSYCEVIYALSQQVNVKSDADVAFQSDDESDRYTGAANHD